MEIHNARDEVEIRRYSTCKECDVVVIFRGHEMVLTLPNYGQAVKWARLEAKSYGITTKFPDEHGG
jgi:hypothetical protein